MILFVKTVKVDLKELHDFDLEGAPYGYTPFCDSRKEMDGYRLVSLLLTLLSSCQIAFHFDIHVKILALSTPSQVDLFICQNDAHNNHVS